MEPSGSVPDPANVTDWPARMVMSPDGLVMVPVGGWLPGVEVICTQAATEGTPALLRRNSM